MLCLENLKLQPGFYPSTFSSGRFGEKNEFNDKAFIQWTCALASGGLGGAMNSLAGSWAEPCKYVISLTVSFPATQMRPRLPHLGTLRLLKEQTISHCVKVKN